MQTPAVIKVVAIVTAIAVMIRGILNLVHAASFNKIQLKLDVEPLKSKKSISFIHEFDLLILFLKTLQQLRDITLPVKSAKHFDVSSLHR